QASVRERELFEELWIVRRLDHRPLQGPNRIFESMLLNTHSGKAVEHVRMRHQLTRPVPALGGLVKIFDQFVGLCRDLPPDRVILSWMSIELRQGGIRPTL